MKYLILITMLSFSLSCVSQSTESFTELKPPFNTQGEQEDYWAQELFKKE